MLADNIIYCTQVPCYHRCPACPALSRHVALAFTAPVAAVTTESTIIHPGFLGQFYMAS